MAGIFSGLIFDEQDQLVEYKKVGDEEYYVINDDGFFCAMWMQKKSIVQFLKK